METVSSTALLPEAFQGARDDIMEQMGLVWQQIKAPVIVPLLRLAVFLCLTMSLMLFVERVYMAVVIFIVKLLGKRPEKRYKWEPMRDDLELGNSAYPMVLVQIPMYNEKEDLVVLECQRWASKGINIKYEIRDNRKGYKAGALKEGMKHGYVKDCDYVAIFDADFQPEPDFLWRTIPFLVRNPELALVQARWKFVNSDECLMTRMQEMSLDYHFTVEQEVGSSTYAFFGFNGTAGVWRISAINEAGGWKDRTTVEDMDLAVRASLKGWKFVFLGDLKVKNELPSTLKAYRYQQHRWSCGPANLFRKMLLEIARNKKVSLFKKVHVIYNFFFVRKIVAHIVTFVFYCMVKNELPSTLKAYRYQQHRWSCGPANLFRKMLLEIARNKKVSLFKKVHVIYNFFFVRKIVAHIVTFVFYCMVIPATVLVPEVEIPTWGAVYIPSVITLLNAVGTPRSLHLLVFWILFENVMSLHRTKATFIGLLEAGRVNEWVVTEKLGDALKTKVAANAARKPRIRIGDRLHLLELGVGAYLFFCGCYDVAFGKNHYFIFLFLQAIAFFIVGLGYVGTFVPHS
ncbi:Glucomannan 4-beta-mannosyltransferase 1 [Cocos nucifera]|uniref:glucomannan 4-beta-mannosyltransferase n=1 Tax=Cocos nucifera TaxID=13894 RepID=A0A8K0IW90_COCNU|nr:Glucomannan 4-beta-mannosyltransferase 1 [Cocos nucifera]